MVTKELPDTLYQYQVFCNGPAFRLCSTVADGEVLWKMIREIKHGDASDNLTWWSLLKNGSYERFFLDTTDIIGIADKADGAPVLQPNVREQRRQLPGTNTSALGRQLHPGRAVIGKTAKKPAGRKR